ncbi:hypothetical protein NLJ89_g7411 [Agrocybe chaxingu]|uniref:Uncharacterized protein n=1 Tax=Agrocybe chaxingu TaxID=84603 RepID=A0A9W8JX94_9AGAR|nr:hypothetical protein NLJ89_g7411 [Agrocybe chaxingu]
MAEYGYAREPYDPYMASQNHGAQWPDMNQYANMAPNFDDGGGYEYSEYGGSRNGHSAYGRGRRDSRGDPFFPGGHPPTPFPHATGGQPLDFYDLTPAGMEDFPGNAPYAGYDQQMYGGRPPSRHSMYPMEYEQPPLHEHYPLDIADDNIPPLVDPMMDPRSPYSGTMHQSPGFANAMHGGQFPGYVPTHRSGMVSPAGQYAVPNMPAHRNYYSSRRRSRSRSRTPTDTDYSRSSDSYDSYDRHDRRDPYSHHYYPTQAAAIPGYVSQTVTYRTVHPSLHTPTVIKPSRTRPIVVPINGGTGGYVVIPAVGQTLRVVDPRGYNMQPGDSSLLNRFFSPSKWGVPMRRGSKWF